MSLLFDVVDTVGAYALSSMKGGSKASFELQKAQDKYNFLWLTGQNKGLPMELLGYPKPKAVLMSSGMGGGGGGLPGFLPPSAASLSNPSTATNAQGQYLNNLNIDLEQELSQVFENVEESKEIEQKLREDLEKKTSDDDDVLNMNEFINEFTNNSSGENPFKTPEKKYIRPKKKADVKKLEDSVGKRNVVRKTLITKILDRLIRDKTPLLRLNKGDKLQQNSRRKVIRDVLTNNWEITQEIIDILTNTGIDLTPSIDESDEKQAERIAGDIENFQNNRTGIEHLLLVNEFLSVFYKHSQNEFFRPFDTSNYHYAERGDEIRLPAEIPQIHQRIRDILMENGVDRVVASRFAVRLIDRTTVLANNFIDQLGGVDVGIAQTNKYLDKLIEDLIKELKVENKKFKMNPFKIKELIYTLLKDGASAIREYATRIGPRKTEIFTRLKDELLTPAEGAKMPEFRNPVGAVGEMFDYQVDETLPTIKQANNWYFDQSSSDSDDFPDVGNLSDVEINNNMLNGDNIYDVGDFSDEGVNDMGSGGESYDPLPRGNIIINNMRLGARLLAGWNKGNMVIGWNGYYIYREHSGDPDDDDDPNRGNYNIVIETPRGKRKFNQKNFVGALVILGMTASSIIGLIAGLSGGDKKKINVKKKKNNTVDITIKDVPKTEQTMDNNLSPGELPFRNVDTNPTKGGANHLGITDRIRKLGLVGQVNNYNDIVNKFNRAVENRDIDLINQYKKELDTIWEPISDRIINRGATGFRIPKTGTQLDFSEIQEGATNAIKNPTKEGEQLKYLTITQADIDSGLGDIMNLANNYIKKFNEYSKIGDHSNMAEYQSKLNGLSRWVSNKYRKSPEDGKTYLTDEQVEQEIFPTSPIEQQTFAELQGLERLLDPSYKDMYNSYVNETYGVGTTDPLKYYQNRINKIKELQLDDSNDDDGTNVNYDTFESNNDEILNRNDDDDKFRPSNIDPAEADLFLSTSKEIKEQQKRWSEFSRVEPGNGLGSLGFNTLRQHNAREYKQQFTNNFKQINHPTKHVVRPNPKAQPKFIPVYQSDYGDVVFEDSTPNADYARRNQLTDERLHSDNWREYENTNNIYMPEGRLLNFHRKPVMIPEIRNHGYDRYLSKIKPSQQSNVLYKDVHTGYLFTEPMRNDNFNVKTPKRNIVYTTKNRSSTRF